MFIFFFFDCPYSLITHGQSHSWPQALISIVAIAVIKVMKGFWFEKSQSIGTSVSLQLNILFLILTAMCDNSFLTPGQRKIVNQTKGLQN